MQQLGRAGILAGSLIAIGWLAPVQAARAACEMARRAEIPFYLAKGEPRVDAEVNGRKGYLVFDTSSATTVIFRSPLRAGSHRKIGGESVVARDTEVTQIGTITLGGVKLDRAQVPTGPEIAGEPERLGTLGRDLLGFGDMEVDWRAGKVRYFRLTGCSDAAPPISWTKDYSVASYLPEHPEQGVEGLRLSATVNGRAYGASVESLMRTSHLPWMAAVSAGVPRSTFAGPPLYESSGKPKRRYWAVSLPAISIGEETVNRPSILASDHVGIGYIALGQDFLQTHRILFARSLNKAYFSYAGGKPFNTSAPAPDQPGD